MKNYPRIYSLSTLNLIHHQECDYLFHNTRTDFMGDSASGKSIIADLLQLIFVGSTAFKSATANLTEKRDPDGLVLTSHGKGTDIGYAFLSIEIADEQFITIGAYFESTSKNTKPFIIQSSTEIENEVLVPMHTPLVTNCFKNGSDIYDLNELEEVMENKGLVFKKWERINPYHRILYKNNILPLDLASNNKTLNDYAKIIQSFSRGKTLDTQKSTSLLEFLFGLEKAKELYSKYLIIIKEFETTILSYGKNVNAINLLSNKYNKVCSLKMRLEVKKEKEKEYLTDEVLYYRGEYKKLFNNIKSNTIKILRAYNCLQSLVDISKKVIELSKIEKVSIDKEESILSESLASAQNKYSTLKEAETLLGCLKIEVNSLETFFSNYQQKHIDYLTLQELKTKLDAKNLYHFFEQSKWINGMKVGNEYFNQRINKIKSDLLELNLLSEYTDINNPESLVRWAVSLNRPLTKLEESLVFYFQNFKRTEPKDPKKGCRYLPTPEALFENHEIKEDINGVWINLGGVWEYIHYVPVQHLNTIDQDTISKYFELQNQNITQQIDKLEGEEKDLKGLNDFLCEFSNAPKAIEVYILRKELEDFNEIEQLKDISSEKIKSFISCLKEKEVITNEFEKLKKKQGDIFKVKKGNDDNLNKLPIKVNKAEYLLQSIERDEGLLNDVIQQYDVFQSDKYDLSFFDNTDDKIEAFEKVFEEQKKHICLIEIFKSDKSRIDDIKVKLYEIEKSFQFRYNEVPHNESEVISINKEDIDKKERIYIIEKHQYDEKYDDIVAEFIPNESYRFENDKKDFATLITYLLPDIFNHEEIINEEVISKIENRLTQINNKNRVLNSKKTQRIGDLLDDVKAAVSCQKNIVRKINLFFNNGEKKISGNYDLKLIETEVKKVPISWLSDFKVKADSHLSLFDDTIADKLSVMVSIEEKILEAYSQLTGNRNNDITIEDLLNPNSYMDLCFKMQDVNGRSNKGSTGQTYTAIASLCIARLSIVGNKHSEKDRGIRFMPIDEAEGLGSNLDMLYEIAQKYDYQIITFAINPLGRYNEQFIYILHRNLDIDANINYTPVAIRSKDDIKI